MPSRMALTDYTTPTSVSFRYSPLMSAMTCSAGQRSAGSECRDDETSVSGTIAGPQSSDDSGARTLRLCGGGSVSAVVVRARGERAVFIGSISVWDTIGTLPSPGMRHGTQGASQGAWPAALRAGPTGVPPSTRTFLGAPPTPHSG